MRILQLILLTILGFIIRMINIVKPEGLWNDEYVSWMISATSFSDGFWSEVIKQCHMPIYYLYLKPFAQCSDLILRLTSVIPSVIAIPVMYLLGKEYSEKAGVFAATITAVLPFLVYYSQEVRFYSLLFLLSALTLLFAVKIIKNNCAKYRIFYTASACTVIFTHVLGFIYIITLTAYLIYKTRKINIKYFIFGVFILILALPLGILILKQSPSAQWWGIFSYTNIMFLFSDFLSPILSNNVNAPPIFFYNTHPLFMFLITIPTIIGITCIISGSKREKGLAISALAVVLVLILIALTGKLVFITKYTIEILPILILLCSLGIEKFGKIGYCLFAILIFTYLFSIFTPYYPAIQKREEGHNYPAIILNYENPDRVIYTYYSPERFQRYLKIKPVSSHISKINRHEYSKSPNIIFANVKKGEKLSIVFLDSVSFINDDKMDYAIKNNFPEMFITFSSIRNSLEKFMQKEFKNVAVRHLGAWTVISGVKF